MRCIVLIFLRLISKGVKNGGSFAVIFCVFVKNIAGNL